MTKQQIFNKVAKHLLTQGKKSVNKDGNCLYRGPRETMCAIGVLIPESRYKVELENVNVTGEKVRKAAGILPTQVMLALDLQDCHDTYLVGEWADRLIAIAEDYKLKPTVVTDWQESRKRASKARRTISESMLG